MNYTVKWTPKSVKVLSKLPKDIALRIWNKTEMLKENPFRYLEHYEGSGYKFRIGEYRLLIDVDFDNKVLIVRVFNKRERIYGKV